MSNITLKPLTSEKSLSLSLDDALKELDSAMMHQKANTALVYANQIIEQAPKCLRAYSSLFKILSFQQNYLALEHAALQALKYNPEHALSYLNLSNAYRFQRKSVLALKAMEKAVKISPNNTIWLNNLGIMHKELGHFDRALKHFEQCINLSPDFTKPYWHRSDIKAMMPSHYVEHLTALVSTSQSSNSGDIVYAAYALFKHFEASKDFTKAFFFLNLGATQQRKSFNYNHHIELTEHENIASVFNEALLTQANNSIDKPDKNKAKDSPIFICGLPRSGTTLAEQIISSHTSVAAGDELFELAKATQLTLQQVKPKQAFPFLANELSHDDWLSIGEQYLQLTKHINTKRYFTDKMPLNYKAIGLIHLALPHAKIVYCQRPPMDLLLGAYKQILEQGNKYTYDLDELTSMIIAQHNLMQHWLKVLPGKIFTLNYQSLITQQQETTEKLLAFLGLEWQEQCLSFHENSRIIHTISNTQVRQPIYTSALNSWKRYEKKLSPYAEKMVSAGLSI